MRSNYVPARAAQKENPPEDTSGLSESIKTGLSITSVEFDTAIHVIQQSRSAIRQVLKLDRLFCSRKWDSINIPPDRLRSVKRDLAAGFVIYSQCFRTDTRRAFKKTFGVSFRKFEIALQSLGDNIGEPVHRWGRR
jgi:hypothetical protein